MAIDYGGGYQECNLEKYECWSCNNQFIVGTEMLNGKNPCCPYCKSESVEKTVWTEDDNLRDLDLGCLSLMKETTLDNISKTVTDSDTETKGGKQNGRI